MALSEIEIYVREDPESMTQTPYCNENGTGYILPEGVSTIFEFDKVGLELMCLNLPWNELYEEWPPTTCSSYLTF